MATRFDGQLRWLHKVRLYPTCAQERSLVTMLRVTRELYNALLQQRRDAWRTRRIALSTREQYGQLTELREADWRFASVYRECEDAVLHRLHLAFAAFYRRVKRGESPGYPRFKAAARWNQLEFPHGERALKFDAMQRRVRIPGFCKQSRDGPLFTCVQCRHAADADVNAAQVILLRAESPPMRAPGTARGRLHDAASPTLTTKLRYCPIGA